MFEKKAMPPSQPPVPAREEPLEKDPVFKPAKSPAFYARRKKRGNEICQILIRNGDVKPEQVRRALKLQEERGGQIGRILVKMGACSERAIARALTKQVQLVHASSKKRKVSVLARENPAIAGLTVACSPVLTSIALLSADLIVLASIGGVASACDFFVAGHVSASMLHYGIAVLVLCAVVLGAVGTYNPTAPSPPDDIRRTTITISLIFLCNGLVAMFGFEWIPWHVHAILFFEWALSCVFLPTVRALVRGWLSRQGWWGVPVVVLGAGRMGRTVVHALQSRPNIGLRPVLVLDDDVRKHGTLRASLKEDHEIGVNSIRDVPVQSISRFDIGSVREPSVAGVTEIAIESPRDGKPLTVRSSFPPNAVRSSPSSAPPPRSRPNSSSPPNDAPERPSSFPAAPSEVPPAPPTGDIVLPPSSRPPATQRAIGNLIPGVPAVGAPQDPIVVSTAPPPPNSSRSPSQRAEPSGFHQMPESLRGLVRGQFAEISGVPIVGGLELAPLLAERLGISYGIIAMPGQNSRRLLQVAERVGGAFSHLLLIPDLVGFASIGVPAREIAGVVGIEVRQQLLLSGPRLAKRTIDLVLTCIGGLFVLPVIALLWLLVRVDSPGPVFYSQKRMGRDGKKFTAYKFRSMYGDGEARLKAVLEADPKLRAEYEEFHKLAFDPRITRIGRILRKYSLDELPQIWNVLNGDMSLVGPRPYLEREVPEMEHQEGIILRAMPGMTGLWQVSDRNATGFAERLKMDVHYVRNWSPWLDIYILARTIGVVLAGTGS